MLLENGDMKLKHLKSTGIRLLMGSEIFPFPARILKPAHFFVLVRLATPKVSVGNIKHDRVKMPIYQR